MTRTNGHPLESLRHLLASYPGPRGAALPPAGVGLFVFLSYELNRWIERLPTPKPSRVTVPELAVYGMRVLLIADQLTGQSWCVSLADPEHPALQAIDEARERLEQVLATLGRRVHGQTRPVQPGHAATAPGVLQQEISQAQFESLVRRAQQWIAAGDIFQANVSQAFSTPWQRSSWSLYTSLRAVNPSPFAALLIDPEFSLVSCSPERLVRVAGERLETRPIAGTRPRGRTPDEDVVNSLELLLSEKERAEHIMLVDLERNDLGRVCRYGSVHVEEFMALEEYSHVIHIVSNVAGTKQPGVGPADIIRAMFPGGTITGCPKVRCMEILHELEPVARGAYTGSLGWIGFDGSLDLNLLIRTITLQGGEAHFHVGAGIVADSQPDREYHETLAKAGALLHALQVQVEEAAAHASTC